jgi:SAM-dependent methyltransferase
VATPVEQSYATNRRHWDALVDIHLRSPGYRVAAFKAGEDSLHPIEAREIGDVGGKRLLHLQCHFGLDTLSLARRGAIVTGLDFSPEAVAAARRLAADCAIDARFVEGNLYDAPRLIAERFDIVYTTWGTIYWLPDIRAWAATVAAMLAPGGFLYFLDLHPFAALLDQRRSDAALDTGVSYFHGPEPIVEHVDTSYSGAPDRLVHTEAHVWIHPLGAILEALTAAGLAIDWLHEHETIAWRLLPCLEERPDGLYSMPAGGPRLPLALSIRARR